MDRSTRPDIKPGLSLLEIVLEAACPLIAAAIIIFVAFSWSGLPGSVPMHFNASGAIDRIGPKHELLTVPIIFILIYFLMTLLERFPKIFNFPFEITEKNAASMYQIAREMLVVSKTEILLLGGFLILMMIRTAQGHGNGLGFMFLPIVLIILGATTGLYIYRMYKHKDSE